ncbi:MAG: HAMP domain-containing protein, partial [Pseudomonadota bacterium]|nr:HAMP domain-containing protein [Pseudomonadota bacterium]
MKRLISPAVALMNHLPMVYKFTLISILFLLPIGGLAWLAISELNHSVETGVRSVQGLDKLQQVGELLEVSSDYRDIRAPGKIKDDQGLLARSEKSAQQIDALIRGLAAAAPAFDTSGSWAQQVRELHESWQQLRSVDSLQSDIDPQFRYYDEFVQQARALMTATIEISAMGQGGSGENTVLLGLVRDSLPDARQVMGQARSYGVYALLNGQVGYALSDAVNNIYDRLTNQATLLNPALDLAAEASPRAVELAGNSLRRASEGLIRVRDALDQNIIVPMRLEMPWNEYAAIVDEELQHIEKLNAVALDVVGEKLDERLAETRFQRLMILVSLLVVLLVVVYLYIGFFVSVRTAVKRFGEAARNVAAGDMTTHIELDNRDELGELTAEFNGMTDRIAELI